MSRESEILESATAIVLGVLRMPAPVLDQHKRGIINGMIWSITEARGKYRTRYRSKASLVKPTPKLHHEHVVTRKDLIDRIMAAPDKAGEILSEAIGCVVTVEEHRKLAEVERRNPSLRGWDRYREAGVEWVDMDNPS